MRIAFATPAGAAPLSGNAATTARWRRRLEELGHEVDVLDEWQGGDHDLLLALHAAKSGASVARWRRERPDAPCLVALAGTDMDDPASRAALEAATRILVLQPEAARELPEGLRDRVDVVVQSAVVAPPPPVPTPNDASHSTRDAAAEGVLRACVLAHLRAVKNPLLPARAAALLPAGSRVRIRAAGLALDDRLADEARRASEELDAYEYLGPLPREEAMRLLAESHVLVVPSHAEGGANVVSEAIAAGVPVLASAIPGNLGLLGADWPATFPPGDAIALAALLARCERDGAWLADLRRRIGLLAERVTPEAEREALRRALDAATARAASRRR